MRLVNAPASQPLRRPLRSVPLDEFVKLAVWALGDVPERDQALASGLIYLAEGKGEAARERLRHAAALGADVANPLRELDAERLVAEGLVALEAKDFKTARERFETALDQYGGTVAVVTEHLRVYKGLRQSLAALGEGELDAPPPAALLPLDLRRFVLLPEPRLAPTPPAAPAAAYRGQPLQRGSPTVAGLPDWRDYTIELEWTPERGGSFLLLFRLSEPRPGEFTYYYLDFDGQRLVLGRMLSRGVTALATCPCPSLAERRRHRAVVSAQGSELVADVDKTYRLRAADGGLALGNVALATGDAQLLIHELSVLFPSGKPGEP